MTWAKLDDQFPDHPKVRSLGVFGLALQAAAICYCSRYLTDGYLSWSVADQLIASVMAPFTLPDGLVVTPAVTSGMSGDDASDYDWKSKMVEAGLWHTAPQGFTVHDYLDYNPTRESVLREREKTAQRVGRFRKGNTSSNGSSNTVGNAVTTPVVHPTPDPYPYPKDQNQEGLSVDENKARVKTLLQNLSKKMPEPPPF
jgi:hypothetical protein